MLYFSEQFQIRSCVDISCWNSSCLWRTRRICLVEIAACDRMCQVYGVREEYAWLRLRLVTALHFEIILDCFRFVKTQVTLLSVVCHNIHFRSRISFRNCFCFGLLHWNRVNNLFGLSRLGLYRNE